jgi:hypothetical protein
MQFTETIPPPLPNCVPPSRPLTHLSDTRLKIPPQKNTHAVANSWCSKGLTEGSRQQERAALDLSQAAQIHWQHGFKDSLTGRSEGGSVSLQWISRACAPGAEGFAPIDLPQIQTSTAVKSGQAGHRKTADCFESAVWSSEDFPMLSA